jgi:hypothetical protein
LLPFSTHFQRTQLERRLLPPESTTAGPIEIRAIFMACGRTPGTRAFTLDSSGKHNRHFAATQDDVGTPVILASQPARESIEHNFGVVTSKADGPGRPNGPIPISAAAAGSFRTGLESLQRQSARAPGSASSFLSGKRNRKGPPRQGVCGATRSVARYDRKERCQTSRRNR